MNFLETISSRDPVTRRAECETHGSYESRRLYRSFFSGCPQCRAEREVLEEIERDNKRQAERIAAWERKLESTGIPDRFRDRSLESFVANTDAQRRALDFARNYADSFDGVLETGRSALFIGKPGTGKTHLAAGIGLHIMSRSSRRVLFSTVMRAIRHVKDTWRKDSEQSETEAIATLASPDLLILDEVGDQFGSVTEKMIMFDVLNERYGNRLPTLLISNLDLDGVKACLDVRIFDRLREGGGEAIVFDWQSHRGQS